jgi:hypothetical protein
MSLKSAKKEETERFEVLVRAALTDAHAAAAAAFAEFMKTAPLHPEGYVNDVCGSATVVVYNPSYRLRNALKALNEVRQDHERGWWISDFSRNVRSQSKTANETACRAARDVLREAFVGEGEFYVKNLTVG